MNFLIFKVILCQRIKILDWQAKQNKNRIKFKTHPRAKKHENINKNVIIHKTE